METYISERGRGGLFMCMCGMSKLGGWKLCVCSKKWKLNFATRAQNCFFFLTLRINFILNFSSIFKFIFSWRMIALQCCVVSAIQHHKSVITIHIHIHININININIYIPSSWASAQPPSSCPLRLLQSARLVSLGYTAAFPWLSVLHMAVYICQCYFLNLPHPFLPHCVHKSTLYVCVSIPSRQIGSLVPFF